MTSIVFKRCLGKIISFKISGHSGFADSGEDIVCSAVSAVSLSTVIGITEVLNVDAKYHMDDGFLSLSIEDKPKEVIENCQVLFETMLLGLKRMEMSYGEYIKVEIEEV